MKKQLILLTGFLSAAFTLQAQQKQSKFIAELSGGPSFALGKFGNKTYSAPTETDPAGMAKTGLAAQLSLGYKINESFGIILLPGYSVHKQDPSSRVESIKDSHSAAASDPTYRLNLRANKWKLTKLMAGGFFVTPLTESSKLALVTKLAAGVCKTDIPGYTYTETYNNGFVLNYFSQGNIKLPWTFCYQVSVGLKYKLKDNIHLLFDINSFNSTPTKDITYYRALPTSAGPSVGQQINVKYKLAELNTLVGIGFDF